jgi:hypothetical protein
MTEPDFFSFLCCFALGFYRVKERKTGRIIGLKNKRVLDSNGCKKNLS